MSHAEAVKAAGERVIAESVREHADPTLDAVEWSEAVEAYNALVAATCSECKGTGHTHEYRERAEGSRIFYADLCPAKCDDGRAR